MMRLNNWIRILGAGIILLSVPAGAKEKPQVLPCAGEKTPAFPGAEGFGAYTQGGRGGSILFITNLSDYNPEKDPPVAGSLRAACETKGPRIILFRISGIIALKSPLAITEPFVTIAGQIAPGEGICIKDYGIKVLTNEVVLRYFRVRPADNMENEQGFRGDNVDGISVTGGNNIVIDHCSASWSVDETLSVTHSDRVTVQWCMITESLNCSAHHKGCHGYGSLVRGEKGAGVSYHHNLYAHHADRNPRPGGHISYEKDPLGWTFDFRNNILYNWGGKAAGYNSDGNNQPDCVTKMNFIGNYYINGPDSKGSMVFNERSTKAAAYFSDNWMNGNCPENQSSLVIFGEKATEDRIKTYYKSQPFTAAPVTTDDAETAFRKVVAEAGAVLPVRDPVDNRIVDNILCKASGGGNIGHIIDDEEEVGGWPDYKSIPPPADKDGDGMPDSWEKVHALNPLSASDGSQDADRDGYTNVEEYLNNTNPQLKDNQ